MSTNTGEPPDGSNDRKIEAARAEIESVEHRIERTTGELVEEERELDQAKERLKEVEHDKIVVTLIWGGTGASKPATVSVQDTAGEVFKKVYKEFGQTPTDQDTFEVNEKDFPRTQFGEKVEKLVHQFGPKLVFEVIPPASGA